jgi:phosphoribosylaminoimidazole-succinocarboxamide synthase
MNDSDALFDSAIPDLPRIGRGKVRDIYSVDDNHLLIVTDPVPGKGRVLTELSNFWFRMMEDLIPNHLTGTSVSAVVGDVALAKSLASRSIVVKRLKPLPIEAVVRGYLIGSGWRDYLETIFTPATKAEAGDHDENISFEMVVSMIGEDLAVKVRDKAIQIYERAAAYALERGIIIADTKFEFGLDDEGRLYIIDEVLTPDSSRFWPLAEYRPGISPPSFDKQFVRDYLDTLDWDKTAPGPALPAEVLKQTSDKYREALQILTG